MIKAEGFIAKIATMPPGAIISENDLSVLGCPLSKFELMRAIAQREWPWPEYRKRHGSKQLERIWLARDIYSNTIK